MLTSPESNIPIGEKALAAEELAKVRLDNIEKEIRIAQTNLSVINDDITKAIEAKTFHEESLQKAEGNIEAKKAEIDSLSASKTTIEKEVSEKEGILASLGSAQEERGSELDKRESEVAQKETELAQNVAQFDIKDKEQIRAIEEISNAKDSFELAVKSVKWR